MKVAIYVAVSRIAKLFSAEFLDALTNRGAELNDNPSLLRFERISAMSVIVRAVFPVLMIEIVY